MGEYCYRGDDELMCRTQYDRLFQQQLGFLPEHPSATTRSAVGSSVHVTYKHCKCANIACWSLANRVYERIIGLQNDSIAETVNKTGLITWQ